MTCQKSFGDILILFLTLLFLPPCEAQNLDTSGIVTTVDFRGNSLDEAILTAAKITNNSYIVVLIKGGNESFNQEIKGHLKALINDDYKRIGLVLADLEINETNPVIGIFSDGTLYAVVKDAKADLETGWKIYNLVRDAYQEHIWPKLGKTNQDGKSN